MDQSVRGHARHATKRTLVLVILTIAGGAGGGVFWWMASPISFSWQLPPLAFRMLGAAGFAFAITGLYVMHRRRASLIRDYIILLAVYLVPLVGAILLFHLDRFNWHAPITYAFFIVAGGMAAAAVWFIACRTMPPFDESPKPVPSTLVRSYLFLVMVIFGAWGLTLFISPSGRLPQIWVWPQDALTTRLIATMLLTIGTAGLLGRSNTEAVKMSACMFVVYGFGVMVACAAECQHGQAHSIHLSGRLRPSGTDLCSSAQDSLTTHNRLQDIAQIPAAFYADV